MGASAVNWYLILPKHKNSKDYLLYMGEENPFEPLFLRQSIKE
jgi:hypothetical protein